MRRIDLTGQTFGVWTAEEYIGNKKYLCRCICGEAEEVFTNRLKERVNSTCKHTDEPDASKLKFNLENQKYGEWTIGRYLGNQYWECTCSCGNVRKIHSGHIRYNRAKLSCGHDDLINSDLKDKYFGEWHVLCRTSKDKWLCRCSCNKEKEVSVYDLIYNKSTSCGHDSNGFKDLTDKQIGEWKVIKYIGNQKWLCECSCKKVKLVDSRSLNSGTSKSCGHKEYLDLKGQKFGEWTAIEWLGNHLWKCECSCENKTVRIMTSQRLRSGDSLSCGCKKTENYINTVSEKYGVKNVSQLHLSDVQLKYAESKESLEKVLKSLDIVTPHEISKVIGITPCQVMRVIRKFGLEDMVELNKHVSSYESEINELFPCNNRSDRTVLDGKEIDLYYPELNLGIEFNGNYWHSELFKPSNYHIDKSLSALTKNVELIHIFEYEWINENRREKIIKLLNKRFGKQDIKKIYARNCNIIKVDSSVCSAFLDEYHLQGNANASIRMGLEYEGNLVGVMTFGTPRFNSDYQYELVRLCWRDDVIVIGGAEKLFEAFIKLCNPKNIVSYCDIAKFSGQVYKNLGFKEDGFTAPNYIWLDTDTNEYLTRYQTQKHRLIELGLGTEDQTEVEIMSNLGFLRIYDCGNYRFIWNKEE